jgi:hypothetical protein
MKGICKEKNVPRNLIPTEINDTTVICEKIRYSYNVVLFDRSSMHKTMRSASSVPVFVRQYVITMLYCLIGLCVLLVVSLCL